MDERRDAPGTEPSDPKSSSSERSRSGRELANPRRVRWSTLAHGTLGLVAAGALAGGALVGGATQEPSPADATASRVVPVLWLTSADSTDGVGDLDAGPDRSRPDVDGQSRPPRST